MRSGFEKVIAKLFKKQKITFKYEADKIPYTVIKNYIPDFKIGNTYIEAKGRFSSADRTKMLLVKEQHPELDIRLWFQRDNWLTKTHKQRYSDWAKKYGFQYHIGDTLPKDWFKKDTK